MGAERKEKGQPGVLAHGSSPVIRKQRQEDRCKFEVSLGYTMSLDYRVKLCLKTVR